MALGVVLGILFSKSIKLIKNNESVEIMLTMLLAHFTFISAEYISHYVVIGGFDLKVSGVIATAYAAIIMGNYGKTKISPKVESYMERFRNFFAFLANSLIFLLM
jgi:CPA1 family monovalent cation:H+ antiporter